MYEIKTSATFDSAHFLRGYNGKCANIHGHTWTVEATMQNGSLISDGEKRGMVMDFSDLKKAVRAIAERFDHTLIYEKGSLHRLTLRALELEGFSLSEVPFRPTAENLAQFFFNELSQTLPVSRVEVRETPQNLAAYGEE